MLPDSDKDLRNTLLRYFSFYHPGAWLLLSVVLLQSLLLFSARSLPFSSIASYFQHSYPRHNASFTAAATTTFSAVPYASEVNATNDGVECPFGKVYIYDLPRVFNADLVENCGELDPWHSRCQVLSNDGFGLPAAGISKILPENLAGSWFWTDQFALELIFHNRMANYKCRTTEAESATAFYIPFYAGLAVGKYLWPIKVNYTNEDRDRDCKMMVNWIQDQPYWNRSNGRDHFITMGRITWDFRRKEGMNWGSSCIFLPGMRNITRLLIEAHPWDYYDVAVPYPTGFHPTTAADITRWQQFLRTRHRNTLFCFAGAPRRLIKNDFRALLLTQCNHSGACRAVDCGGTKCSNGTSEILEKFLDSDFCLQPRGDSLTRRSTFDCMVAGSIPVFFWKRSAYYQYRWFFPPETESYSVFIHRDEVKNGTSIKSVLEKISKEKVNEMRNKVIDYIPNIIYAKPNAGIEGVRDAFDIAIEGVLRRAEEGH
ncbi:xyloglucan galactosyltransferase XLT2 [Ipomoea triloba]|uniref:xyloglucan galactosyltransferase XLT2 n=1 Tax=Ipomoea triloba TaxID=35885 RepID=UPI00125DA4D2|nr:xyloglucan galactosyltransferase XLT2 [Ipomoea triloba]